MAAPKKRPGSRTPAGVTTPARQARLAHPKSANDLVRILGSTKHYPSPVRPLGNASSSTRCTEAPGGTLVDLSEMNRVLRIDRDSVTAQPGISLAELADVLDAEGLELIGGIDQANRSLGGAISAWGFETSASADAGGFAANVLQIKFVTADGRKGCVNSDTLTMLRLFRLSYGLLGIAYEITLRVRPIQSFNVKSIRIEPGDVDNLLAQLAHSGTTAKLKLFPFRGTVHCELRESSAIADASSGLSWRLKSWTANSALPAAALKLARMLPVEKLRYEIVDSIGESTLNLGAPIQATPGPGSVDQLTQTNLFGAGPVEYSSWAFAQQHFAQTITAWFEFCREHFERTGFRCDPPAIAYPSARDANALLSPSFDQAVVTVTAMSLPMDGWSDFAFDFADFAVKHGGIPLFSQSMHSTTDLVRRAYNKRWIAFCGTRRQLDPDRRFVNSFFESFLAS